MDRATKLSMVCLWDRNKPFLVLPVALFSPQIPTVAIVSLPVAFSVQLFVVSFLHGLLLIVIFLFLVGLPSMMMVSWMMTGRGMMAKTTMKNRKKVMAMRTTGIELQYHSFSNDCTYYWSPCHCQRSQELAGSVAHGNRVTTIGFGDKGHTEKETNWHVEALCLRACLDFFSPPIPVVSRLLDGKISWWLWSPLR